MQSLLRSIKKGIIWILIAVATATILIFLTSLIPNSLIRNNVETSLQKIPEGVTEPMFLYDRRSSIRDCVSERIMLKTAINNDSMDSFQSIMDANDYARYWHGYLVFLRPLLLFFDIEGIYFINQIVFFTLLFIVILEIVKQRNEYYGIGFLLSLIPAYIFIVPLCMEYYSVFLIAFLTSVLCLKCKKIDYSLLFFTAGCLSSYVDLLSCPLVSLIIPMTFLLLKNEKTDSLKKEIETIFSSTIAWGVGYGVLWASKWLIGSVVLHRNVLADAIDQVAVRASDSSITRITAIIAAIEPYFNFNNLLIICLAAIELLSIIILVTNKKYKFIWKVCVQCIPVAWYFFAVNHSYIHNFMTYRNVIIIAYLAFIIIYEAVLSFKKENSVG